MRIFFLVFLLIMGTLGGRLRAEDKVAKVGPAKGALVIVGGGTTTAILQEFIKLAGGVDSEIVVIPTASGKSSSRDVELFEQLGATKVRILHNNDPEVADTEGFVVPLKTAKGVWFGGGRQWRLVDAYKNTKVEKMLWKVLDRGGVIGGSSAGASIQGSYLARGDSKNNQIMTGDHEQGFGYLKEVAIDQHLLARNRHFDMFTILKKHPHLLGLGIDERTAIVVKGDRFQVMGLGNVAVYDGTFWSREGSELKHLPEKAARFYFLKAGDRYDLSQRRVIVRGE
ncbi:MAG: cyanophycinase [Verrucomicrobiota bacterium]